MPKQARTPERRKPRRPARRKTPKPERRASPENPSTPLSDPDAWLFDALGAGTTTSGVRISAESSLKLSAVWRAVNLISTGVAKLPLIVYRRQGEGKERDPSHPAYSLLHRRAHPRMSSFQLRLSLQPDLLLHGNGFAYIDRNGRGDPVSLIRLSPTATQPFDDQGELRYRTDLNGRTFIFDSHDILHLRGIGDGIMGKSVIAHARESLGISAAAQQYSAGFFGRGARPSIALAHPRKLGEDGIKNLRRSFTEMYVGPANAGVPLILEEGMTASPFSMSHEDAQFLETRAHELREIANWFGVPSHKVGDTTKTSYASLEQENQAYLDDTLDGWLAVWEAELWEKLLRRREQDQDTHIVEFLRQAMIRVNLQARYLAYNTAIQGGWMSRDEARGRENLNPIPDGSGAKFFVPLNMTTTDQDEEPEEEAPAAAPEEEAPRSAPLRDVLRELLADVARRMARRLATHARKAARKPDSFIDWLEEGLEQDHRPIVSEAAEAASTAARVGLGLPEDRTAERFAGLLLEEARSALFAATDYPPQELEHRTAAIAERLELRLSTAVPDRFLEQTP